MKPKPGIAISSCLLGNRVRYDGELKHFPELCAELAEHFQLLPVCPEVEIGLSVPRPPVQLSGDTHQPRMIGRDDPTIDITDPMRLFCQQKPAQLRGICGYVFKSRSPSCGLRHIPVVDAGNIIDAKHRGLFAQSILDNWPDLPVAEETDLLTPQQRQQFIRQVLDYYEKQPPG